MGGEQGASDAVQPDEARPVYRSARTFAFGVTRWLALQLVFGVVVMAVDIHQYSLLGDPTTGFDRLDTVDSLNILLSTILLLTYVISVILFLAWLFRAYGQLGALGIRHPRYGRGWTIGSWFVPILNLARPLHIVNDVWRSGDPDDDFAVWHWQARPLSNLLGWWWAFWLFGSFMGNLAFRTVDANSVGELQTSLAVDAVAQGASVPAGVLAILVVRRCTARQDARAEQLAAASSDATLQSAPA